MNMAKALGYAVALVNGAEGFTAKSFLDTNPNPHVWTIGHGTTRINGALVTAGMTCTSEQADLWAMADMSSAAHYILAVCKVPLEEHQMAALISFCYNIGDGNFHKSSVLAALNMGLYTPAANRLLEYDESGGHVMKGLDTRRARERAFFLIGSGLYVAAVEIPLVKLVTLPTLPTLPTHTDAEAEADTDALNAAELGRVQGRVIPVI